MVTIRHYRDHWALQGQDNTRRHCYLDISPDPRLPRGARDFWRKVYFPRCNGGVVARDQGEIVGICRYEIASDAHRQNQVHFKMAGTWVDRLHRRDGLATRMWRLVFRQLPKNTRVHCTVVSKGGEHLVRYLAQQHPRLDFQISYGY